MITAKRSYNLVTEYNRHSTKLTETRERFYLQERDVYICERDRCESNQVSTKNVLTKTRHHTQKEKLPVTKRISSERIICSLVVTLVRRKEVRRLGRG